MDLRLRTREVNGAVVIEVDGEVELHCAPQLREELHRVCEGAATCVVVDLSRVSFIDSTGLGVLIGGLKRAREKGTLSLVCPQQRVKRIFEITGLTQVFTLFDTVDAAIGACSEGAPSTATSNDQNGMTAVAAGTSVPSSVPGTASSVTTPGVGGRDG
jgi:anti-sigma B factor antagonist